MKEPKKWLWNWDNLRKNNLPFEDYISFLPPFDKSQSFKRKQKNVAWFLQSWKHPNVSSTCPITSHIPPWIFPQKNESPEKSSAGHETTISHKSLQNDSVYLYSRLWQPTQLLQRKTQIEGSLARSADNSRNTLYQKKRLSCHREKVTSSFCEADHQMPRRIKWGTGEVTRQLVHEQETRDLIISLFTPVIVLKGCNLMRDVSVTNIANKHTLTEWNNNTCCARSAWGVSDKLKATSHSTTEELFIQGAGCENLTLDRVSHRATEQHHNHTSSSSSLWRSCCCVNMKRETSSIQSRRCSTQTCYQRHPQCETARIIAWGGITRAMCAVEMRQ